MAAALPALEIVRGASSWLSEPFLSESVTRRGRRVVRKTTVSPLGVETEDRENRLRTRSYNVSRGDALAIGLGAGAVYWYYQVTGKRPFFWIGSEVAAGVADAGNAALSGLGGAIATGAGFSGQGPFGFIGKAFETAAKVGVRLP